MYFGNKGTVIQYSHTEHKWVAANGDNKAYISAKENSYLFGHQNWSIENKLGKYYADMSLSACNASQYTCKNGTCIDIDMRCNGVVECIFSGSDEIGCNNVQFPNFYASSFSPIDDGMTVVNVSVKVLSILAIDEDKNKIRVEYKLSLFWKDSRLQFYNLKNEAARNKLTADEVTKIWKPVTAIKDIDLSFRDINEEPSYLAIKHENSSKLLATSMLNNAIVYGGDQVVLEKKETLR